MKPWQRSRGVPSADKQSLADLQAQAQQAQRGFWRGFWGHKYSTFAMLLMQACGLALFMIGERAIQARWDAQRLCIGTATPGTTYTITSPPQPVPMPREPVLVYDHQAQVIRRCQENGACDVIMPPELPAGCTFDDPTAVIVCRPVLREALPTDTETQALINWLKQGGK